jgi:hypothetical protein
MSHFAKVEDGIVVAVQVADQDWVDAQPDSDKYIQTSYNTRGGKHYDPATGEEDDKPALRQNYASVGGHYDTNRDAFYNRQPFPSWTLNETTLDWEPPVPSPYTKIPHIWNEDTLSWEKA